MRIILSLLLAVAFVLPASAQKIDKKLKSFEKYIEQARQDWNVPGVAVAIVKDGEIIYEKGFGVKSVDTNEPVDENTVFAVASNTKSVTAAALAILVDEGKINWDDKVQEYLPWFQLYDPYVSANLTIRDLLCHRSGLETFSGDLIWYGSNHSREEVLRRARFLEPAYGFREHFGYQNIMFLAAGEIIPVVTDQEWEEFVSERILSPLEMNNTYYSTSQLMSDVNKAMPHNTVNDNNVVIEYVNWDNIAPAGALVSSVHDWSQWMIAQMNMGMKDTTAIWSENEGHEMWAIQTPEAISPGSRSLWPSKTFSGYGLGWELQNLHGVKIVSHGGGYDGMISRTLMIPEENMGIVVLTNNISSIAYALTYAWADRYMGEEGQDWSELFLNFSKSGQQAEEAERAAAEEARDKDSKPSLPLEAYAGTYGGEMYGNCEIRVVGDQLAFQFEPTPLFRGTMRHWQYDSFQLNWGTQMMLPPGTVQFILNPEGEIEEMIIDVPNPDFDFTELEFKKLP